MGSQINLSKTKSCSCWVPALPSATHAASSVLSDESRAAAGWSARFDERGKLYDETIALHRVSRAFLFAAETWRPECQIARDNRCDNHFLAPLRSSIDQNTVQLLAVDHSDYQTMRNVASCVTQCELQSTMSARFSNAYCRFESSFSWRYLSENLKLKHYRSCLVLRLSPLALLLEKRQRGILYTHLNLISSEQATQLSR